MSFRIAGTTAVLAAALPLAVACANPADDDTRAPLSAIEVTVEHPDTVRASEDFAAQVHLRNPHESRATGPIDMVVWYVHGDDEPLHAVASPSIEPLEPGEDATAHLTLLLPADAVALGGAKALRVCLSYADGDGSPVCTDVGVHVRPDLAALCAATPLSLPASGSTDDHQCATADGVFGVVAVETTAGASYTVTPGGTPGYSLDVYDQLGREVGTGSTPDGSWFASAASITHYVVFDISGGDYDFVIENGT